MKDGKDCKKKAQLATDYEAATNGFAASVTDLQRKTGTSSKAEYERLQRISDEARVKSEKARLTLERTLQSTDADALIKP